MLMDMNIAELEAFIAVAEHGNYSRAAEQLAISQPAISRRISLLEGDLGDVLLERGRHGARLTPAGETFLAFAKRAVGELATGMRAVNALQAGDRGVIKLAMAGTIPNTSIMETLRRFRAENPHIRLSILTAKSDEVSELVASGEVDAGLRYFADQDSHLESFEIANERGGLYCAKPTSLLDVSNLTPEALSNCPWVMFPTGTGSSGEPFTHRILAELTRMGVFPREIVQIDGLSAQKRLVASDFGIALMQSSGLADELAAGTVQRIAPGLIDAQFPIHLILRKHRYTGPLMDRFIASLHGLGNIPV